LVAASPACCCSARARRTGAHDRRGVRQARLAAQCDTAVAAALAVPFFHFDLALAAKLLVTFAA